MKPPFTKPQISQILRAFAFILFLITICGNVTAASRYAVANGNWNVTTTWSATSGGSAGASVPVAGDDVWIGEGASNRTLNIPAGYAAACGSLSMGTNADNTSASLSFISNTSSLSVSGNLILYGPSAGATINLNLGTGSMTIGGNLEIGSGQTGNHTNRICKIVITTGNVTLSGNLTFNEPVNPVQAQIDLSGGAGTFNLGGSVTVSVAGTVNPGTSSTFNFNGSSAQTIPIGVSSILYNNIDVNNTSAGGATLSADVTSGNVNGNIRVGNISSGSLLNTNNHALAFGNSNTLNIAAGSTFDAGTTSILFGTTGSATINGTFKTANNNGFSGSGTTAIRSTNTPAITLGISSTIDYTSAGIQTVTARTDYINLILSGGGTKNFQTAATTSYLTIKPESTGFLAPGPPPIVLTVNKNLTINNSGTFTNNGKLILKGHLINQNNP